MDNPTPITVTIDLGWTVEVAAEEILRKVFPDKKDWKDQFSSTANLAVELFTDVWSGVEPILKTEGLEKFWIEQIRKVTVIAAWNQVITDLFGSHITVAVEEPADV